MIKVSLKLVKAPVRHLSIKSDSPRSYVVWWYGAMLRNRRDRSLPQVVVWLREWLDGITLGPFEREEVGITDLALLQIGTVWKGGLCRSQTAMEERQFDVDFSPGSWSYISQSQSRLHSIDLIPPEFHELPYKHGDKSNLIEFRLGGSRRLLVPSLEFFSRCYGRSAEVNRILCTYPWSEAEGRLFRPSPENVPSTHWSLCLPAQIYNDDAIFLAHVKYDKFAQQAARRIYSDLESQFSSSWETAFPQIGPWFVGQAKLIVEGIKLDADRFLALRIVGGSVPGGPPIASFRENAGQADGAAPDSAPQTSWAGRPGIDADNTLSPASITPISPPGHNGSSIEVFSPVFRIVGKPRDVTHMRSSNASTRPRAPASGQMSVKHSPGERYGTDATTGRASIHTETQLESQGAARDVWNALVYLRDTYPEVIESVGWYSLESGSINASDKEPTMVTLSPYTDAQQEGRPTSEKNWVYADRKKSRPRGVLIAVARTTSSSAYIFEIERRTGQRHVGDGKSEDTEQAFRGLIVLPPAGVEPASWVPQVLSGIRDKQGIMPRVASNYCSGYLVHTYRRSSSKEDKIAGHSTVVNALGKVDIVLPHPKTMVPENTVLQTPPSLES